MTTTERAPATSPLSRAPRRPGRRRGHAPRERGACTSPATRSTPTTSCGRTSDVLHAHPVQAPHAHAQRHPARRRARPTTCPGVVRVLTAADVPGINDAGHQARRAAVPVRGHVLRPRGLLGARRDPRGRAARRGGGRGRLRRAAGAADRRGGDRGRELPGRAADDGARRRGRRAGAGQRTSSRASPRWPGRSTSTSRRTARWRLVDENGQVFVQSSTQHPTETQEIVAHVLGVPSHARHRPVPADGRRLRRQGDAAARPGGGRGARRHPDRPAGAAAAEPRQQDMTMTGKRHGFHATWKVGFDDDGRFTGARGDADLRRRLEPRPVRAGALAGAVPRRQRLLDPRRRWCTAGSRRPTRPRRPRSAASAGRRGCS